MRRGDPQVLGRTVIGTAKAFLEKDVGVFGLERMRVLSAAVFPGRRIDVGRLTAEVGHGAFFS